ncbi:hypothetical protein CHARACLAT_011607 [Characodon lateralis]|uniref:Uncharacterized protein n=1 Tax=Characodon lateralis TaxID=208331 RepID=A0ABU7F2K3_9TELE|nr:hypothetical protein [Characodon lateralis]
MGTPASFFKHLDSKHLILSLASFSITPNITCMHEPSRVSLVPPFSNQSTIPPQNTNKTEPCLCSSMQDLQLPPDLPPIFLSLMLPCPNQVLLPLCKRCLVVL